MLHVAICDNNEMVLNLLESKMKKILGDRIKVSKHNNPFSLMTYIIDESKGDVDVVFIDICLGSQNGIRIAEVLLDEQPNLKFVFMSSELEQVKDIFRVNPVYFLMKPFEAFYLKDALSKLQSMMDDEKTEMLKINISNKLISIKLRDIYYIESDKRQVIIHLLDKDYTCYAKLDDMENELNNIFVRCHQSYIINMDKIEELTKEKIVLTNEAEIPISRSKIKEVIERIREYNDSDNSKSKKVK